MYNICFFEATVARLGRLRLTTSHTYLYKKLDEFGEGHNQHILDSVKKQGFYMEKKSQAESCNLQSEVNAPPASTIKPAFGTLRGKKADI